MYSSALINTRSQVKVAACMVHSSHSWGENCGAERDDLGIVSLQANIRRDMSGDFSDFQEISDPLLAHVATSTTT